MSRPASDYAPFVREDEQPIEIDKCFVTPLPTRPRTGIVRLCAKGYSQTFVLSTATMYDLCRELVRVGLRIEERPR